MQMEQVDLWRMPMWMEMMNTLPASVRVDLNRGSYVVYDSRMRCIYADDLSEEEIDQLIYEWALLFEPSYRRLFVETLEWKTVQNLEHMGLSASQFEGKLLSGGVVRTKVVFAQYEKSRVAEFQFQKRLR